MLKLDFSSFPILNTSRLVLRCISAEDVQAVHQLRCDQAVNVMVGRQAPDSLSQTMDFINRIEAMVEKKDCLYWVMASRNGNGLIGTICCWNFDIENEVVEIGYEMLPEFRGQGLMKEALKKVIDYTFTELHANLITAFPSRDNVKSVALLKALNFQLADSSYNNKHTNIANMVTYVLKSDHDSKETV